MFAPDNSFDHFARDLIYIKAFADAAAYNIIMMCANFPNRTLSNLYTHSQVLALTSTRIARDSRYLIAGALLDLEAFKLLEGELGSLEDN